MPDGDEIIEVPWNSEAWECAIRQRTDIGRIGGEGDWVLYTPGRLLVDAAAAQDPRVQEELRSRVAMRADEPAAETARRLGLTLFTAPDDRLVDASRAIRALIPGSASLDHVWLPGPNSVHGDDLPLPAGDPGDIPGPIASAGSAQTIYVLDTGIAPGISFAVEAGAADAEIPDEDQDEHRDHAAGHGTHVAGLIARTAPGSRIVVRRLLTSPVGMASELDTAQAILDAGEAGASLINCSFGGTTLFDAPPLTTERALAALPPGTVVVAAAGNNGSERPHWPAASKRVIAVGSVARDDSGDWKRTDFSNFGHWVDCCAPGVAIASTFLCWQGAAADPVFEGHATWSGTSFSCPQVTAAIAALAARDEIEPSLAAYLLVDDPKRDRIGSIGTLVEPDKLP
jgi:subtilisin family serine protease